MKKIILLLLLAPVYVTAQNIHLNYTKAVTMKEAATTLPSTPTASQALVEITYLDGLGRPVQQVALNQANNNKDIRTHIGYDLYGRQTRSYLPFVTAGSLDFIDNGEELTEAFYTNYNGSNANPYSEQFFEAAPNGRVLKQAAPGNIWQADTLGGADHTIKFVYDSNIADEVRLFRATTEWNAGIGYYSSTLDDQLKYYDANVLYKTITRDENWTSGVNNTTEEFKNQMGQVLLKRTYSNEVPHDTYYVYDIYGNLSLVLPPMALVPETIVSNSVVDGLCYQYKYDDRNRIVAKKLPGKLWEYIVYDHLDRPVLTGPVHSPFSSGDEQGWLLTKYDGLGRVIYTGYVAGTVDYSTRFSQQEASNLSMPYHEQKLAEPITIDGIYVNYSNDYFIKIFKLLTVNYYDNYIFRGAPDLLPETVLEQTVSQNVMGLATGTWVRVPNNPEEIVYETTYTLYDLKYRPIHTYKRNHHGGYTETDSQLDFTGKTLYTRTRHSPYSEDDDKIIRDFYEYDAQDHLTVHKHKVNNNPEELLVHNVYDGLGQLAYKNVGGTDTSTFTGLQQVDYTYNIRGWLTGINNINDLLITAQPMDLFSMKIAYTTPDDDLMGEIQPLYNGNICETYWRTNTDGVLRKYSYSYDQMNRLLHAYYQKPEESAPLTHSYDESLAYDKNGNITELHRNGYRDLQTGPLEIDDLDYSYAENSNQLMKVMDATNNSYGFSDDSDGITDSDDDYNYDEWGNLTSDANKGITGISYNHLNLPVTITLTNGDNISYLYTATGQKVQKKVRYTAGMNIIESTSHYMDGIQYTDGVLKFIPTAEGYVNYTAAGLDVMDEPGTPESYNYVYNYTDHLGNIRFRYGVDPSDSNVKKLGEDHYYPFGLKHENYNSDEFGYGYVEAALEIRPISTLTGVPYNYKFQGQERQDELGLNWDSFKWRNYDYAIGRFMTIDPLTEDYSDWAPYVFSGNRVIDCRELEGLEPYKLFKTEEEAALNWGEQYNDDSIKLKKEMGSTIGRSKVKGGVRYSYGPPAIGTADAVDPSPAPKGTVPTADIHSHGAYRKGYWNDDFSSKDKRTNDESGLNGYLAAPDGTLQLYIPHTTNPYIIYKGLPNDPKDPASPKPLPATNSPKPKPAPSPAPSPSPSPSPPSPSPAPKPKPKGGGRYGFF